MLPSCATGEWSPAFALSEPEAGSEPAAMRTTAVQDGDEWVLNGTKNWITNAGVADFYVVFALTDRENRRFTAFVVETDRPGFSIGQPRAQDRDQGLAHRLARVRGRARARRQRGRRGRARDSRVALGTLERTRLGAAAQAVGIAQGATDYAVRYAKERVAFGKPIVELQGIQFKLADMETRTAAARELLYKACAKADRDDPQLGKFSLDGEAVRLRHRDGGHGRGGPGPRRLRLRQRVPASSG